MGLLLKMMASSSCLYLLPFYPADSKGIKKNNSIETQRAKGAEGAASVKVRLVGILPRLKAEVKEGVTMAVHSTAPDPRAGGQLLRKKQRWQHIVLQYGVKCGGGARQLCGSGEQASEMARNRAETTGFIPNLSFHSKCVYSECRTIFSLQALY